MPVPVPRVPQWNAEGLLKSVDDGSTGAYTYDGDGRRVKSSEKMFWYGAGGELLEETDVNGMYPTNFIYYGGERVAKTDPYGQKHFFFADRLGSVGAMTDAQGVNEQVWMYYPFGGAEVLYDSLNNPNTRWWVMNRMKFTGLWRDDETGLDHTLYRQYSSTLGRWLSPDPMLSSGRPWNPQTWNRYAYALNNPLAIVDPTGLYNLVSNCAQDDQKCNKQFQRHAKDLRAALSNLQKRVDKMKAGSEKRRLEVALKAMGTENDKNNVNVIFGAAGSGAGQTDTLVDAKTGALTFNVTLDPTKIGDRTDYAINAAHEGTHVADISDPRFNDPATTLSPFAWEYRAYQTSAWAASALGLSSLLYGGGEYQIWNSSWATVDDKVLTRFITDSYKDTRGQPYKEATPHNPWDN